MFEFEYLVQFYTRTDQFYINIFCQLDTFATPAYMRAYPNAILYNRKEFIYVYHEIKEYLDQKHVIISKDDLRLLYSTISQFNLPLPEVKKVRIIDVEELIDRDEMYTFTPKEMLFLAEIEGKKVYNDHHRVWLEEYHIDDQVILKNLMARGLISVSDDTYVLNDLALEIIQDIQILKDFHHSFYRYSYNLSVDEFYVLSRVKSGYSSDDLLKLLVVNQNRDQLDRFDWRDLFHEKEEIQYSPHVVNDEFSTILNKYEQNIEEQDTPGETKIDEPYFEHRDHEELESKVFNIFAPQSEQDQVEPVNEEFTLDSFYKILSKVSQNNDDHSTSITEEDNLNVRSKLEQEEFNRIIFKTTGHEEPASRRLIKDEKILSEAIDEITGHKTQGSDLRQQRAKDVLEKLYQKSDDIPKRNKEHYKNKMTFKSFVVRTFLSSTFSLIFLFVWYIFIIRGE